MTALAKQEVQQNLIPAQDAPMVAMIERIAMDPNIPIDRLEKMLAMKERMEDRNREMAREDREYEAKTCYFSAMSLCQAELPVVVKNRRSKRGPQSEPAALKNFSALRTSRVKIADDRPWGTPLLTRMASSTSATSIT